MKTVLVLLGWLLAVLGVYMALLALEYYWNVPQWQPSFGWPFWVLFAWLTTVLAGVWFLSRVTTGPVSRAFSSLLCLALIALAVYVLPPEPNNPQALFGREAPSPLWYRGTRFLLLAAPGLFLGWRMLSGLRRPRQREIPAALWSNRTISHSAKNSNKEANRS